MVDQRAHAIPGGHAELNAIAGDLFGKPYLILTDEEASKVWDDIDSTENPGHVPA